MIIENERSELDQKHERLWDVWKSWHNCKGEFPEVWKGYNTLCDEAVVSLETAKDFMKLMRKKRIGYAAPTMTSEGIPSGSGNFINFGYQYKSWNEIKRKIIGE